MSTTTTRRLAAALCALAIGAVAAGCGGEASGDVTVTVPDTTGGVTTNGVTTAEAANALTLVERLPTPSEFLLFEAEEAEEVDLEGFVDAVGDGDDVAEDRAALATAGFVRAAVQDYRTDADAAFAQSFVVEVSADGAPGLADHVVDQLVDGAEPGVTVTEIDVATAQARGVELTGTGSGGPVSGTALVFTDGPYLYGVQVAHQSDESLTAALSATATAWRARVAGAPPALEGPPPVAPGDAFPNAAEIRLLTRVPAATADDCERTSDTARAAAATTSVRCDAGTHRVYYEEFATVADMRASYDGYLEVQDIARGEGTTCDDGAPAEGVWDGPTNRVTCFIDDAGAWVVWNSTELKLVAVAIDPDANLQRVFDWWKGPESGPIR